jgi:hypothetical protein
MIARVVAINCERRLAVLNSGAVVSIASMIDIDGNRTDDPDQCFIATVEMPDGSWGSFDMREFGDSCVH